MVADEKIRKEIKDRVEKMSSDKLNSLLEYIKALELPGKETDNRVLLRLCLELDTIANQGLMNLASSFLAYLTRQTRQKRFSQNHNSLIFMTNPLQT